MDRDSCFLLVCPQVCLETGSLMSVYIRSTLVGIEPFIGKIQLWRVPKLMEKVGPARNLLERFILVFSFQPFRGIQLFCFGKWFVLFFKIFHFALRLGGRSACELVFHLKNSRKIPLLRLSPFQMEAVRVIPGA